MASELTKFTLDGTELDIVDTSARSTASSALSTANTANTNANKAQTTANNALSTANTADTNATDALTQTGSNTTAITKINETKIVKTATYNSTTKTLAITTGNIG